MTDEQNVTNLTGHDEEVAQQRATQHGTNEYNFVQPDELTDEGAEIIKANGVWDSKPRSDRYQTREAQVVARPCRTLLHETAHAVTGPVGATREFEWVLTDYLGKTSGAALEH